MEQVVQAHGGHFEDGELSAEALRTADGVAYRLGGWVEFPGHGRVFVRIIVNDDLALLRYGYHREVDDEFACRLDKHTGHVRADGGMTHLHHADGRRVPADEIDVDDAIGFVLAYVP